MSGEATTTRVLSASSINGACYLTGQGINFVLQLLLVHQLGKAGFGALGVAQMCIMALIFIGELGMPSYFIREVSIRDDWRAEWLYARRLRSAVLLAGLAGLVLFWCLHYETRAGLGFILCAIPAVLISARNVSPLLIAQDQTTHAALGLLVLWGVYALATLATVLLVPTEWLEYGVGAALSLGYFAAMLFLRGHVRWPAKTTPHGHHGLIKRAFIVWFPSLLGTVYGVLLTFIVQHLAPGILVYFLLGGQLLQGISGLNLQLQRVLLSALSAAHHAKPDFTSPMVGEMFRLCGLGILIAMLGMFSAALMASGLAADTAMLSDVHYFALIIAEWLLGILGTLLVTSLMSQHKEGTIYRATVKSFAISMALQVLVAAIWGDLLGVLLIRMATSVYQLLQFYRALRVRLSLVPLVGMVGILALGVPLYTPALAVQGAVLCGTACLGLMLYGLLDFRRMQRRVSH